MGALDACIKEINHYVKFLQRDKKYREFVMPADPEEPPEDIPVRLGSQSNGGLILKEDTFVELGAPGTASLGMVLSTNDLSLARDGNITLIGSDINELPKGSDGSLPFGQVIILGGSRLRDSHYQMLRRGQHVGGKIEGYMIRAIPGKIWSRVSNKAMENGFSLRVLGMSLMAIFKNGFPMVEKVEIIFITSNSEDVNGLKKIAFRVDQIAEDLFVKTSKEETMVFDCDSCPDKPVCDEIRELRFIRKIKKKGKIEELTYQVPKASKLKTENKRLADGY